MTRYDDLQKQIDELRERLDALAGKPCGPVSMTEARLAYERGDMQTVKRFEQQENERILADRRLAHASNRSLFVDRNKEVLQ